MIDIRVPKVSALTALGHFLTSCSLRMELEHARHCSSSPWRTERNMTFDLTLKIPAHVIFVYTVHWWPKVMSDQGKLASLHFIQTFNEMINYNHYKFSLYVVKLRLECKTNVRVPRFNCFDAKIHTVQLALFIPSQYFNKSQVCDRYKHIVHLAIILFCVAQSASQSQDQPLILYIRQYTKIMK